MSTDDVAALVDEADSLVENPQTLDPDDLVEAYGLAERLRGVTLAFQSLNEATASPSANSARTRPLRRLQNAVRALRGREPVFETSDGAASTVTELQAFSEETGDLLEGRADAFQETLAGRLTEDAHDDRGFH